MLVAGLGRAALMAFSRAPLPTSPRGGRRTSSASPIHLRRAGRRALMGFGQPSTMPPATAAARAKREQSSYLRIDLGAWGQISSMAHERERWRVEVGLSPGPGPRRAAARRNFDGSVFIVPAGRM